MAIELSRQIYSGARERLLDVLGASEIKISELELKLTEYQGEKDWGKVEATAQKLKLLGSLRSEILGIDNPFEPILEKFAESDLLPSVSAKEIPPTTELRHGIRKPDKYIPDAIPTLALGLIGQESDGSFKYNSLREIGTQILQTNKREDKKAANDARLYVYQEAFRISNGILGQATELKSATMAELLDGSLPDKIPNKLWQEFYARVRVDYGQVSPTDFVTKVLLRFHSTEKVRSLTKDVATKVKEHAKRQPTKFGPGDITPLEEIILCNRIATTETYTKLTKVFGGRTPMDVAVVHGYSCPSGEFTDCLLESREKMAKLRENKQIDSKEGDLSIRKIQKAINIMSKDRMGWHKLNSDYRALQFVYALVAEVGKDQEKIQDIVEALFPEKTYTVDSKNSFFIMPGIGNN